MRIRTAIAGQTRPQPAAEVSIATITTGTGITGTGVRTRAQT